MRDRLRHVAQRRARRARADRRRARPPLPGRPRARPRALRTPVPQPRLHARRADRAAGTLDARARAAVDRADRPSGDVRNALRRGRLLQLSLRDDVLRPAGRRGPRRPRAARARRVAAHVLAVGPLLRAPGVLRVRQRRRARARPAALRDAGDRRPGRRDRHHAARGRLGRTVPPRDRHHRTVPALPRPHRPGQGVRRAAGRLRAVPHRVGGAAAAGADRRTPHGDQGRARGDRARPRRRAHEMGRDRRMRRVRDALAVREPLDRGARSVEPRPAGARQRPLGDADRAVPARGRRLVVRQRR